jgi:Ion transport protein
MSDLFEKLIMGIILINVACLAIVSVEMPQTLVKILSWANVAFTVIFATEAVLKMIALGIKPYFRDQWCFFDFIVALSSVVQLVIEKRTDSNVPAVNLMRVFRVARIFRLVPKV